MCRCRETQLPEKNPGDTECSKENSQMRRDSMVDEETTALIGMCLLCVQLAERMISGVVEQVLDRRDLNLTELSAFERKQTLGDLLKRLKHRVKIEHRVKEKLFKFLEMRNTFVHNLSEVPGWDLKTEAGREVAKLFLVELMIRSLALTALCGTIFAVSAKDDFNEDLFSDANEEQRRLRQIIEAHYGPLARKILAGRYRQPYLVHSSKTRPK